MMQIPPPKSWEEFQDIVTSALKARWSSPTIAQYGRTGQAQQGVDIFGPDQLGRATGVQCKCQESIDDKLILKEIALAETFRPPLSNFYFAIAGPRDARVQQTLRILSEARLQDKKFAVGILFWDDILEDLTSNPTEFTKHFPDLKLDGQPAVDIYTQILSAYDVAYDGLDIVDTLELIFGEIGIMVNEDPLQLDQMLRTLEASAQCLLSNDRHRDLVILSRRLFDTAMAAREGNANWLIAKGLAGSIEAIVRSIEYTLTGPPLLAFDLGMAMRQWERISREPTGQVKTKLYSRLVDQSQNLGLNAEILENLKRQIDEFNANPDMTNNYMTWRAYNFIRQAICVQRFLHVVKKV